MMKSENIWSHKNGYGQEVEKKIMDYIRKGLQQQPLILRYFISRIFSSFRPCLLFHLFHLFRRYLYPNRLLSGQR